MLPSYPFRLWLTNITLNIPLFFLGWRIKGFSFVRKALVGEISLSTWLAIQPVWNIAGDDLLLAAVYGGVILGIGIGMVFLGQGTTGGTDMMAALIQKYMRHPRKNSGMFCVILVSHSGTPPSTIPPVQCFTRIAIPEKPPVTSPVASKTELMASAISPVPTMIRR